MATSNVKTRSGNRMAVFFDGKEVGLVQHVSPNDDYAPEPASGVGDIHVQEWVPSMARHSINVSQMVLYTRNLRSLGLAPENGDAMLQGNVFDILVLSKDSGVTLRKYVGCSYASGGVEIQKHQIVITNAVFNALDVTGVGI